MLQVGNLGNKGGTGRPPSEVRDTLRGSFDTRIQRLEFLADNAQKERDQLTALDMLAKYGLGTVKELSVETVRERVQQTLDIIRRHVTPEQSLAIFAELRPIWS